MATVVSKSLQLETSNVEQYCSADGLSLNAGGYAIRKWLNGSTSGYATLNDAAKNVLYPTATSNPFKIDSEIRGSRSAGSMTVNLEFGGTVVHSESFTSTSLSTRTKTDITDSVVTNSSRDTQIRWNVQGANANNQRVAHVKLVLYFNQYTMSANIGTGANGVQSVSVSNSAPYYGDTVTFTPKLVNGATWDGWYSDAECSNLVGTSQNYSVSPSSDITLYAKATIDAVVYNCSAVAGENIASASVSDDSVVSGDSVTFTAVPSEHCTFYGWFSDSNYATLVSTANPYTATITSDTTLYAKGTKISYSVSVGTAEHGTATVSTNTAYYGDSVTFTFTPENETWELWGWYSDEGLTQLVSESNPYTYSVAGNITLYPKVGKKRYTITLQWESTTSDHDAAMAIIDFNSLTEQEISYLKTGEYENINQNKVYEYTKKAGEFSLFGSKTLTLTMRCPFDMQIAMCLPLHNSSDSNAKSYRYIENYTWWPYYWYQPTENATFIGAIEHNNSQDLGGCVCTAIAKEGVKSVDATSPTVGSKPAIFTATMKPGYKFLGWYSDSTCISLVSAENPASVITPKGKYVNSWIQETSLTLYAKATANTTGTGIYIKNNGTFVEANAVYKKVNGVWVSDVDSCKTLLSSTERVGTIVKRL